MSYPAVRKGLREGQVAKAVRQAEEARQVVATESSAWGRQPKQLAAAQLAIIMTAAETGSVPDTIDQRLSDAQCFEDHDPRAIATFALSPRELDHFAAAETFVGLMSTTLGVTNG